MCRNEGLLAVCDECASTCVAVSDEWRQRRMSIGMTTTVAAVIKEYTVDVIICEFVVYFKLVT
jgi:hypothetical protein